MYVKETERVSLLGGNLGYNLLRTLFPAEPKRMDGSTYNKNSKLETLLGPSIWTDLCDKIVVDFGCGAGIEAIEIAQRGAKRVYGVDVLDRWLNVAREEAAKVQCQNVVFCKAPPEPANVIISLDAFEHFADPAAILEAMSKMLAPDGFVLASFGPTWFHPLGGHLFSVFPWAHLIFSEEALCRWRSHIRNDGATRFDEVEGGLNQMTIARFKHIVESSPFRMEKFELIPIRVAKAFHNKATQEFLTAVVRCKLVLRDYSVF